MNGPPTDTPTKALEFVSRANNHVSLVTIALLAWVASGVEFSARPAPCRDGLLTISAVFGVATLALIPLVQEARRPGQSNFDVEVRFALFGRAIRG